MKRIYAKGDVCMGCHLCEVCQGKDMPACVLNCPNEALVYGEAPSGAAPAAAAAEGT